MRARLIIPSTFNKFDSSYAVVQDFHYLMLKLCMNGSSLASKIGDLPVCAEFFVEYMVFQLGVTIDCVIKLCLPSLDL